MAIEIYKSYKGQSLFDICLQTYGSLRYLFKLIQDNNISNLNQSIEPNTPFTFDSTLRISIDLLEQNVEDGVVYVTADINKPAKILLEDGSDILLEDDSSLLQG